MARQVVRDVMSCLQFRTISYQEFVQELERMLDLAGYLGFGVGCSISQLSPLHQQFAAHLLNSTGVCTDKVRAKLVRADVNGKFPWEPTAPDVVPADVADDNSSDDLVFAPAAVPVAVPLPPVSNVCLSVACIRPKSRTERPRKTKIGTEVVHVTRDSGTTFKVRRSKVNVTTTATWLGGWLRGWLAGCLSHTVLCLNG